MTEPVIALRGFGLTHHGPGGGRVLLENVDLEVPPGRFYVLVGESGSGKSSLLRLWTGLLPGRERRPRTRGAMEVLGIDVTEGYSARLAGRVAAILQDEGLLDELSPRENVELALWAHSRSRKLAAGLLAQVGLPEPPGQVSMLSGGQRKRVAVARAMAGQPQVLICDEPTAGLDSAAAEHIAALLRESHDRAEKGRTTIVITHDDAAFHKVVDATLVLDADRHTLGFAGDATAGPENAPTGPDENRSRSLSDPADPVFEGTVLQAAALGRNLIEAVLRLPPLFPGIMGRALLRFSVEPLIFVVIACSVIGGLATFFALRNNPLEGAFQAQVLNGAGKVLVAVLVPMLSGFFFTARMAAGAAARIGTMQRTGQVHALRMMGIRPGDYLLSPLVWAMTLAMPIVALAAVVGASFASLLAAWLVEGITGDAWAPAYFRTVDNLDIQGLLLKSALSGFLVAVLTYHLGTAPKRSGDDVGRSVNAAIVLGMFTVLMVHSIITYAQFA